MRHPLWLVDSSLLVLFLAALGFTFFSQQKLPARIKLDRKISGTFMPEKTSSISLNEIYENDLFNTYHKEAPPAPVQPDYTHPMPKPPTQTPVTIPAEPKQPFLAPLDIELKGVITLDDDSGNIAMINDPKTKKQKNYLPGDTIEDAQIVRIFSNRVIFVRSNGQQETLYLNEQDIKEDPAFSEEQAHWLHVVKKIDDDHYLLDPETFMQVSHTLAQFIDMLDLTTVYKEGKSIGCRVGTVAHNSLGVAMGLEQYDVITHIDGIPTTTTQERFDAYQKVIQKTFDQSVSVKIMRNNQDMVLSYKLYDLKDPLDESLHDLEKENALPEIHTGPTANEVEKERINLLRAKYKFAPTAQEIKIQQKMAMLKEGKRKRVNDFTLTK